MSARVSRASSRPEASEGQPLLRIGLIAPPSSCGALMARVLERAGCWILDSPSLAREAPSEPAGWDATLMYASSAEEVRAVTERFGLSGPVVVLLKHARDILTNAAALAEGDDFIIDTVDAAELTLRVRKAIQNHRRRHVLRAGRLRLDLIRYQLQIADLRVQLTHGETLVLACLMQEPGCWLPAAKLLELFGVAHQATDPVHQHVKNLRRKLAKWRALIETLPGSGYRLNPCRAAEMT